MKKIKNSNKSNLFKKIFIKICRILGFEIIDIDLTRAEHFVPLFNTLIVYKA